MTSFSYRHRVRYRECDPMGVVYHGHYVDYLEYARTEALRSAGLPYKELEDSGILMPVVDLALKFHYPAKYDDVLEVRTRIDDRVPVAKLTLSYEVHILERAGATTSDPQLAATGSVSLCFVSAESGKPQRAPRMVVEAFERLLGT